MWSELSDIELHVEWMADAESIEFVSDQRTGVGTTFRCRTKVGPLVTTDVMTITRWDEGECIGVKHRGVVSGEGTFEIRSTAENSVSVIWRERLAFPWWGFGTLGAYVARPILRAIWRGNLRRLGERVEKPRGTTRTD